MIRLTLLVCLITVLAFGMALGQGAKEEGWWQGIGVIAEFDNVGEDIVNKTRLGFCTVEKISDLFWSRQNVNWNTSNGLFEGGVSLFADIWHRDWGTLYLGGGLIPYIYDSEEKTTAHAGGGEVVIGAKLTAWGEEFYAEIVGKGMNSVVVGEPQSAPFYLGPEEQVTIRLVWNP